MLVLVALAVVSCTGTETVTVTPPPPPGAGVTSTATASASPASATTPPSSSSAASTPNELAGLIAGEVKAAAPTGVRIRYAVADASDLSSGKEYASVLLIATSNAPKSYSEWPSLRDSVLAHRGDPREGPGSVARPVNP